MPKVSKAQQEVMEQTQQEVMEQAQPQVSNTNLFGEPEPVQFAKAPEIKRTPLDWQNASNEEKAHSVYMSNRNQIAICVKHCKDTKQVPFFEKNATIQEIEAKLPYNAKTGQVMNNEQCLAVMAHAQANGIQEPAYMTFKEAMAHNKEMARLENRPLNMITPPRDIIGVKVAYAKTWEMRPKFNEQGQAIQATDNRGNPIFNHKGEPVQAQEKVFLEKKTLETTELYPVSELAKLGLDTQGLKPKNLESVHKYQEAARQNQGHDYTPNLKRLNLYPETEAKCAQFLKAVKLGQDFEIKRNLEQTNVKGNER